MERGTNLIESLRGFLESRRAKFLTLAIISTLAGFSALANEQPEGMIAIWAGAVFYSLAERERGYVWNGATFVPKQQKNK